MAFAPLAGADAGGDQALAGRRGVAIDRPDLEQGGEAFYLAGERLDRLLALYFRLMARLAVVAEQVELAVGLPRLPDPPEPETV